MKKYIKPIVCTIIVIAVAVWIVDKISCFFEIPGKLFELVHRLSKCIVVSVILTICIYFCFTVKGYPVKRIVYYLLGMVFIALWVTRTKKTKQYKKASQFQLVN